MLIDWNTLVRWDCELVDILLDVSLILSVSNASPRAGHIQDVYRVVDSRAREAA